MGIRVSILVILLMADAAAAQGLRVVASVPGGNALNASVDGPIELHFDRAIDRNSVVPHRTFWAFGRWSGRVEGTISLARGLIVNEDTADLRVFLNKATGDGLFGDFLRPPARVNAQASPSEPADFNQDGIVDVCVANIRTNSVSVLLGNGDGTFAPQQEIRVGLQPRGITVLDADGDGDLDIVNSNSGSSNLSLLLNDGKGVFLTPQFFEGGGEAEWALEATDMDGDGILDLVVGAQASQAVVVNRGVGDGSFVSVELQSAAARSGCSSAVTSTAMVLKTSRSSTALRTRVRFCSATGVGRSTCSHRGELGLDVRATREHQPTQSPLPLVAVCVSPAADRCSCPVFA
jgi:hypothetical protein